MNKSTLTLRQCSWRSSSAIRLCKQINPASNLRNLFFNRVAWSTIDSLHIPVKKFSSSSKDNYAKSLNDVSETKVESKNALVESLQSKTNTLISKYNELQHPSMTTEALAKELILTLEDWHKLTDAMILSKQNRRSTNSSENLNNINGKLLAEKLKELEQIKIICAENMNALLKYHIKFNISSSKVDFMHKNVTRPFYLVMKAWERIGTLDSATKAADVLESWGEAYGGDLAYAPSINEFNVVLSAHACSASGHYNSDGKSVQLPAENAWDIYSFLSQLNDVTLLPDIRSCIHTINALTHHALIMTYAKKKLKSTMNAEVAAIRAFSVWKSMLKKLEDNGYDEAMVWGAHNDILNLSSHGLLRRDEVQIERQNNMLLAVGRNTEALLSQILRGYNDEWSAAPKEYLKQAISSTIDAWTREQKEWINSARNDDQYNEDLVISVTRAALSIEALIEKMKANEIDPNHQNYYAVIKAYHNCLDETVVMLDKHRTIGEDLLPHMSCYTFLNEMERICPSTLDEKKDKNKKHTPSEKVAAKIYETVLASFARQARFDNISWSDIEKVDIIFRSMMNMADHNLLWIQKDHDTCTTALNHTLSIYKKYDGKRHNREIFQRSLALVHILSNNSNAKQIPNVATYSILLAILEKSNLGDSGSIVLKLLEEMRRNGVQLNIVTLTQMIKIMANSDDTNLDVCEELLCTAFAEYDILSEEEKQSSDFNASALYSSFITARIRKGVNDPRLAINLLKKLTHIYEGNGDKNYRPDVVLYGSVLDSLSRSNSESSLVVSLELLDEMESLYRLGGLIPSKQCYTSVLMTISKSDMENAVDKAEDILRRMEILYNQCKDESLKPDHITYSTILRIYAKSKSKVNVARAEEIMEIMENKAKDFACPWPNASVYTSLINIYKNNKIEDMGERSEAVIKRIDQASQTFGSASPKANAFIFGAAISAWASSSSPQKSIKAWDLLENMCDRYNNGDAYCKPSIIVFNHVLKACAYNKNEGTQRDSVKIALMAQKKFLENTAVYGSCDSTFFVTLLKVFGYRIPNFKERQRFSSAVFETCVKEGCVNEAVLQSLKLFSPEFFYKLPGMSNRDIISLDSLPAHWYRNVNRRKKKKL